MVSGNPKLLACTISSVDSAVEIVTHFLFYFSSHICSNIFFSRDPYLCWVTKRKYCMPKPRIPNSHVIEVIPSKKTRTCFAHEHLRSSTVGWTSSYENFISIADNLIVRKTDILGFLSHYNFWKVKCRRAVWKILQIPSGSDLVFQLRNWSPRSSKRSQRSVHYSSNSRFFPCRMVKI